MPKSTKTVLDGIYERREPATPDEKKNQKAAWGMISLFTLVPGLERSGDLARKEFGSLGLQYSALYPRSVDHRPESSGISRTPAKKIGKVSNALPIIIYFIFVIDLSHTLSL